MADTNYFEKTLIAIPTYNEIDNLQWVVGAVLSNAPEVNVLIVDDNSPDGTGQLADALAESDSRVHVLHRSEKGGLGRAYLAAFQWAIGSGYAWVGEFDADGSHQPSDLPRLLAISRGVGSPDVVIGSRWCRGGATQGWSWRREALSRLGNIYVNLVLNLGVSDATAGYRIYRTDFLRRLLECKHVNSLGYGFQIEMTWHTRRLAGEIREVPIKFVERRAGISKMSGSIIKEAFIQVMHWRWKELRGLA